MTRQLWRAVGLPVGLHLVLLLGIYQLGYTAPEWQEIRATAAARGITRLALTYERHSLLGYVRAYFMTDSDERLYREYARLALTGQVDLSYLEARKHQQQDTDIPARPRPYRDVQIEYPPVALALMLPPALVTLDHAGYRFWLGTWLALFHLLNLWLAWVAFAPPRDPSALGRLAWYSLLFSLLLGNIVVTRFDPAVTSCILGALVAFRLSLEAPRISMGWAVAVGVCAGVGVLTKLVPGLVIAAALAGYLGVARPRRAAAMLACLGGFAASIGFISAVSLRLFGHGYIETFTYHVNRGISIDSMYGGALMATRWLGVPMTLLRGFGSVNLDTHVAGWLSQASPFVIAALGSAVMAAGYVGRRGGATVTAGDVVTRTGWLTLGLLLAFLVGNKVFAPQYLMWVAPLVLALSVGRRTEAWMVGLLLAAAVCTQVVYPRGFRALQNFNPLMVGVLNARNLLVVAMLVLTILTLSGPWLAAHGERRQRDSGNDAKRSSPRVFRQLAIGLVRKVRSVERAHPRG